MSFSEFQDAVADVARSDSSVRLNKRELEEVWSLLDVDEDDAVTFREFRAWCESGAADPRDEAKVRGWERGCAFSTAQLRHKRVVWASLLNSCRLRRCIPLCTCCGRSSNLHSRTAD